MKRWRKERGRGRYGRQEGWRKERSEVRKMIQRRDDGGKRERK